MIKYLAGKIETFKTPNFLAFLFLSLVILLPQAVGFRAGYKSTSIDLPRIFILLTVAIGVYFFIKEFIKDRKVHINGAILSLSGLGLVILISALFSESPHQSLILAAKLILIWIIYPLAFNQLTYRHKNERSFLVLLSFILAGLIAYSCIEFLLQSYVFPSWVRTSFAGIEGYEWINSRILYSKGGMILSQGPFTWNHSLGGMLCALFGIVLWQVEKRKWQGLVWATLFFLAVFSTGNRATSYAIFFILLVYLICRPNFYNFLKMCFSVSLAVLLFYMRKGTAPRLVYTKDINTNIFVYGKKLEFSTDLLAENLFGSTFGFLPKELIQFVFENAGTLGVRIAGLFVNLYNYEYWWLTGYGVGAFQIPSRVMSEAIQYDDPGLVLVVLFEFGLLAGVLFFCYLAYYALKGLNNEATWMYAIGVMAYFIFALSSWDIWPLLLVNILVLKIAQHHLASPSSLPASH